LPTPAPKAGDKPQTDILSFKVTPAPGTEVDRSTVLTLDIEYRIADFSAKQFKMSPQFKTGTRGSRSLDIDGKEPEVLLDHAAGRLRLCLPLAQNYLEAERVLWPLELFMYLLKEHEGGGSVAVAFTKPVKLNAIGVPAAALEKQAKAPPPEFEDALEFVFDHFQQRAAVYKVCLQKFPALQPRLTPAYRTWESRHRDDADYVTGIKLEALKEHYSGRTDVAMNVIDHIAEAQREGIASLDKASLEQQCERVIERANPEDDDTEGLVGDYLVEMRKWKGGK
jgi:hypothetical protein